MSKEEDYMPAAAQEAVTWLSKDDAQLALFQAIQAIKLGNPTDDKMILANLREAGLWIGRYAAAPVAAAQEVVAYLDIGAGGYLDLGSNLPEVQLLALPKGRHALGIIGTYGIDGYVATNATAAPGIDLAQFKDLIGFAAWNAINLPETDPRRDFIRQASELRALINASPKGVTLRNDGSMSDCPIIRLAPGEYTDWEKRVWRRGVIECATQPDIAAAMQATSAEVKS